MNVASLNNQNVCGKMIDTFWLITNYSCNFRCSFCYTTGAGFPSRAMPYQFASEVISEMARVGATVATFIGGEPTLYRPLPELIAHATAAGLHTRIITNGSRISDPRYLDSLLEAGLSEIAISIHTTRPEQYRAITGRDNLSKVKTAIANCIDRECKFHTLTTLGPDNSETVATTVMDLREMGVRDIVVSIAVPTGLPSASSPAVSAPSAELCESERSAQSVGYASMVESIVEELRASQTAASFYANMSLCDFPSGSVDALLSENYLHSLTEGDCTLYSGKGVSFDPSGFVLPCTKLTSHGFGPSMTEDGHFAYRGSFDDYWNSMQQRLEEIRRSLHSRSCGSCRWVSECIGGCPLYGSMNEITRQLEVVGWLASTG